MRPQFDPRVAEIVREYLAQQASGAPALLDEFLSRYPAEDRPRLHSSVMIELARRRTPGEAGGKGSSADHEGFDFARGEPDIGWTQRPGRPVEEGTEELPEFDGYETVELIGRGGMGAVYEAIQTSTGRRVALKVMLAEAGGSEESRRRFEREVELAARLSHPDIAGVIDSGLSRGRYFLVMDFVDGRRLNEAFAPGACDWRAAIAMLARICDAIDYAHQRGVLHRDLKPSNILINPRNEPRLLDFGLAKALNPTTFAVEGMSVSQPGQLLGTPQYMPPEQLRGQLDQLTVRSDVYALGVIGYELVSGRMPVEMAGGLEDFFRQIDLEPPPPSRWRRGLGRDLDAILLKALRRIPGERYATAGELAADLRRLLAGRPILARRSGVLERMWRWARRNRTVSIVGGAALILIATTVSISIVHARQLTRLTGELVSLATNLPRVNLLDPLPFDGVAPPEWAARLPDLEQKLRAFSGRPEDAAANWARLGQLQFAVGKYAAAEAAALEACRLFADAGVHSRASAQARHLAGRARHKGGHYAAAQQAYEQALEEYRRLLPPDSERAGVLAEQADVLADLGWVNKDQGEYADAEQWYAAALAALDPTIFQPDDPARTAVLNNFGMFLQAVGRYDDAEAKLREALQMRQQHSRGADDEDVAASLANLGTFLSRYRADYVGAEQFLRQALKIRTDLLKLEHPSTIVSLNQLALTLRESGNYAAARPFFEKALELRRAALAPMHDFVAVSHCNLGLDLLDLELLSDAEPEFTAALEIWRRNPALKSASYAAGLRGWGDLLLSLGKLVEAEAAERESLAIQSGAPESVEAALTHLVLARVLLSQGRALDAEKEAKSGLEIVAKTLTPATHWKIAWARSIHGACLAALGACDEARIELEGGLDGIVAILGTENRYARQASAWRQNCGTP